MDKFPCEHQHVVNLVASMAKYFDQMRHSFQHRHFAEVHLTGFRFFHHTVNWKETHRANYREKCNEAIDQMDAVIVPRAEFNDVINLDIQAARGKMAQTADATALGQRGDNFEFQPQDRGEFGEFIDFVRQEAGKKVAAAKDKEIEELKKQMKQMQIAINVSGKYYDFMQKEMEEERLLLKKLVTELKKKVPTFQENAEDLGNPDPKEEEFKKMMNHCLVPLVKKDVPGEDTQV